MAVAWVLHGVALYKLVVVVNLDLVQRVQRVVIALIVAATHEEELLREWVLHALEIVGEARVIVRLYLYRLYCLVPDVKLEHIFRIFLQEVNYLNWAPVVLVPAHIEHRALIDH